MKSINLLPVKSIWDRWFLPVTVGMVLLLLSAGIAAGIGKAFVEREMVGKETRIEQAELQIAELRQQHQSDSRLQLLNRLEESIGALGADRTEWLPMVDVIMSHLPAGTVLQQAGFAEDMDAIEVDAWFTALPEAVEYMHVTEASNLFQQVKILSITGHSASSEEGTAAYRVILHFQLKRPASPEGSERP